MDIFFGGTMIRYQAITLKAQKKRSFTAALETTYYALVRSRLSFFDVFNTIFMLSEAYQKNEVIQVLLMTTSKSVTD
jgi:hypothetical protein